jgi:hypothetical protein
LPEHHFQRLPDLPRIVVWLHQGDRAQRDMRQMPGDRIRGGVRIAAAAV